MPRLPGCAGAPMRKVTDCGSRTQRCAHVAIGLLAYEVEAAAAIVELSAASGRKHGDNDVRHLGDLRHERKEGLARYFDYSRIDCRAQRQGGGTAIQQADLPHKLSWPNGRRIMALAGEWINYFNLALLDVHEAVRLFALLHHDRALGIRHYLPRRPQCLNMRAGKWCPYHLAQIFAYRLHAGSSGWLTTHITRAVAQLAPPGSHRSSDAGSLKAEAQPSVNAVPTQVAAMIEAVLLRIIRAEDHERCQL